MKKLIILLIVLGLAGSASALTISADTTWSSQYDFDSSGVTVTNGATLTVNARVNQEVGYLTVETGSHVQSGVDTPQWCFPDNNADDIRIVLMDGATAYIDEFQAHADRGTVGIYVGLNAVFTQYGNRNMNGWDSAGLIHYTDSADGYTVSADGHVVTGTPEPATIALLGLGSLALLRRRR